jgi:hypothetical protein
MKPTLNDKLIAYLALLSGLSISAVAIYYSVMGLIAIYPASVIPITVMGVVIELGKLSATVWLKQNWSHAPRFLKAYILPAVIVLMLITSVGVFGFLSKAHSDQSLVSGDVQSKIAIYDEKIKTSKDNIDADRKALKQMDEAVDQVMGRSSDEKGADKAVALRRAQTKERTRLLADIETQQKTISEISEQRAPIAAEVRKVEAEVGPIKYIAAFLYGSNPDTNLLEKAVTWVTILIVIVLDPMAVVLLLASQYSFQRFREQEEDHAPVYTYENFDKPTPEEIVEDTDNRSVWPPISDLWPFPNKEGDAPRVEEGVIDPEPTTVTTSTVEYKFLDEIAESEFPNHLHEDFLVENKSDETSKGIKDPTTEELVQTSPSFGRSEITIDWENIPPDQEYIVIDGQNMHVRAAMSKYKQTPKPSGYVQNEEQGEDSKWNRVITEAEYREKIKSNNDNKDNTNNTP